MLFLLLVLCLSLAAPSHAVAADEVEMYTGQLPQSVQDAFIRNWSRAKPSADTHSLVGLLSTKKGGVGLNFLGARHVILVEPDYNPTTDQQCVDRIFRMGQKEPCIVARLAYRGTLDESVIAMQMRKRQAAMNAMDQAPIRTPL